jgi:hypothetical protein
MTAVNCCYLDQIVGLLESVKPEAQEAMTKADPDDGEIVRDLVREFAKPMFDEWSDATRSECRNALRYALVTGRVDLRQLLVAAEEFPFHQPESPTKFFRRVWDGLLPDELPESVDVSDWSERNIRSEVRIRLANDNPARQPDRG